MLLYIILSNKATMIKRFSVLKPWPAASLLTTADSDFDGESSSDESYTEEVLSESTESSESDEATNWAKMTLKKIHPDLHEDVVVEVVVNGLDNTTALLDAVQEETNK